MDSVATLNHSRSSDDCQLSSFRFDIRIRAASLRSIPTTNSEYTTFFKQILRFQDNMLRPDPKYELLAKGTNIKSSILYCLYRKLRSFKCRANLLDGFPVSVTMENSKLTTLISHALTDRFYCIITCYRTPSVLSSHSLETFGRNLLQLVPSCYCIALIIVFVSFK